MFCIEIEINDQGEISVGVCPPENENEPKEHLNPVANLDEALAKAKLLLQQQQGGSMQDSVLNEMGM